MKLKTVFKTLTMPLALLAVPVFASAESATSIAVNTDLSKHFNTIDACIDGQECPAGTYLLSAEEDRWSQNKALAIILKKMETEAEFSTDRYAVLLKPGDYKGKDDKVLFNPDAMFSQSTKKSGLNAVLGYYTHIYGLGEQPADVVISNLEVRNQCDPRVDPERCVDPGALDNFWRGAENLTVEHQGKEANIILAASQSTPLRNLHLKPKDDGAVLLCDYRTDDSWACGFASGGYMANVKVDGDIIPGSQQQYFVRNGEFQQWSEGLWNMVFVGYSENARFKLPEKEMNLGGKKWGDFPFTKIEQTPEIAEKPYLFTREDNYFVKLPKRKSNTRGANWPIEGNDVAVNNDNFVIVSRHKTHGYADGVIDQDAITNINKELNNGKHLLLLAGDYQISAPIIVSQPNTTVLGMGATLVCKNGQSCLDVQASDSTVSGITVDAEYVRPNSSKTDSLLMVSKGADRTNLHDISCRIGGKPRGDRVEGNVTNVNACVTIKANDVIGDHFWLWRADHGLKGSGQNDQYIGWDINKADHGLVVEGDNVTLYGLFVEHFNNYQTLWKGNNGKTYFYQSELPYDPPSNSEWQCNGENGCASYKVADNVQNHEAWGLGIYSYFDDFQDPDRRQGEIYASKAIEVPEGQSMNFNHMITVYLDGIESKPDQKSGIESIINGQGGSAIGTRRLLDEESDDPTQLNPALRKALDTFHTNPGF